MAFLFKDLPITDQACHDASKRPRSMGGKGKARPPESVGLLEGVQ